MNRAEAGALEREILDALEGLGALFARNELAYPRAEVQGRRTIRDKLAFALHEAIGSTYLVAREWDRVDLAVLTSTQVPVALLEPKAMYSFDDATRYCRITAEDEGKTRAFAPMADAVYSLLLATHVAASVPASLRRVVKYDTE